MSIPLPEDLAFAPLPDGLPDGLARFAGCWLGRWGAGLPHPE